MDRHQVLQSIAICYICNCGGGPLCSAESNACAGKQDHGAMEGWTEDESPFLLYLANGIYADNACESCTPFPTSSNP